jgi:hypothetical protein
MSDQLSAEILASLIKGFPRTTTTTTTTTKQNVDPAVHFVYSRVKMGVQNECPKWVSKMGVKKWVSKMGVKKWVSKHVCPKWVSKMGVQNGCPNLVSKIGVPRVEKTICNIQLEFLFLIYFN